MSETRKTFEGKVYYVTLTVVGWIDVFTRKEYVYEIMNNLKFCQQNKGLEIYAYVIMSNHLHLLASAKDGKLSDILRDFKSYSAKRILEMIENNPQESRREWLLYMFKFFANKTASNKEYQFWQHSNYPIELYKPEIIQQKINYIHNNPVKCGLVANPEDYLYSSANEFSEIKVLDV